MNRQNSMYTLIHDGKLDEDDAKGFLQTIFKNLWTTGPLLFEK